MRTKITCALLAAACFILLATCILQYREIATLKERNQNQAQTIVEMQHRPEYTVL